MPNARYGPIGVDLDNTIISYDNGFYKLAEENGLIDHGKWISKKTIRDMIRRLPKGELIWQNVQAQIYGPRINEAEFFKGVAEFFHACQNHSVEVYVISHKTEFIDSNQNQINIRAAATHWLDRHGFFDPHQFNQSRDKVFFESTRQDKIKRITDLGCTHFIDDLEETFLENSFPSHIIKILFDPADVYASSEYYHKFSAWFEITDYLFRASNG
jgi:hypothetical protein